MRRGDITRSRLSPVTVGMALLMVAGLSACAPGPSTSQGPYDAEFDRARTDSVSDFQRDVLEDGVISDEEFREVRQRYVDCLGDAGMKVKALPDGSYEYATAPTPEQDDAELQCSSETTKTIEPLYYAMSVNPQKEDFSVLTVECLRREGIVDSAFTKENWDQFVATFAAVAGENPDGGATDSDLPTLPGGTRMDDPRVQLCSTNPLGL